MTGIVAGILSDCLSLKGVPTDAASAALTKLINKRHAMLREIVLSEIRQGSFLQYEIRIFVKAMMRHAYLPRPASLLRLLDSFQSLSDRVSIVSVD